jgi:hypothetical protein
MEFLVTTNARIQMNQAKCVVHFSMHVLLSICTYIEEPKLSKKHIIPLNFIDATWFDYRKDLTEVR